MTLVLPYILRTGTSFDREIRMTYRSIQPHTDPSYTDIQELHCRFIYFFILRNIKDLRLIQCWILFETLKKMFEWALM